MEHLRRFGRFVWSIKGKILLTLVLIPVFVIFLFPVDDISDLVTKEVAKATRNQVYVSFDHMALGFLPTPSLGFDRFALEAGPMPPLAIRRLDISPSVMSLLLGKPSASLSAEGLFRGDLTASVSPGKRLENGAYLQNIAIDAQRMNLQDLRAFASLPVKLRGTTNLKVEGSIEPAFTQQPDLNIDLNSPSFELQSTSVETMMGPIVLPGLKLGRLQLKGRLSAGQFLIEDGAFGKQGDDLFGTVKGKIGLELRNINGNIIPLASTYELRIDFAAKEGFEKRAETLLMLITAHRTPESGQGRYRFLLTGDARSQQFKFDPIR